MLEKGKEIVNVPLEKVLEQMLEIRKQEAKKANCKVIIKDFELMRGFNGTTLWHLWCTDVDSLSPCEFVLSFYSDNIEDKLTDALRWRKVIRLCDMIRW